MTVIRTSDSFISCAAHVYYAQSKVTNEEQTLLMETDEFKRGPKSHRFCIKIEQQIVVTRVFQKWSTIGTRKIIQIKSLFTAFICAPSN